MKGHEHWCECMHLTTSEVWTFEVELYTGGFCLSHAVVQLVSCWALIFGQNCFFFPFPCIISCKWALISQTDFHSSKKSSLRETHLHMETQLVGWFDSIWFCLRIYTSQLYQSRKLYLHVYFMCEKYKNGSFVFWIYYSAKAQLVISQQVFPNTI